MSLRIKGKEGISNTSLELLPLEGNTGGTYQTQTISAGEILELSLTGNYKISYSGTKPFLFGDNTPDSGGGGEIGFPAANTTADMAFDFTTSRTAYSDTGATTEAGVGDDVQSIKDSLNDIVLADSSGPSFKLQEDATSKYLVPSTLDSNIFFSLMETLYNTTVTEVAFYFEYELSGTSSGRVDFVIYDSAFTLSQIFGIEMNTGSKRFPPATGTGAPSIPGNVLALTVDSNNNWTNLADGSSGTFSDSFSSYSGVGMAVLRMHKETGETAIIRKAAIYFNPTSSIKSDLGSLASS